MRLKEPLIFEDLNRSFFPSALQDNSEAVSLRHHVVETASIEFHLRLADFGFDLPGLRVNQTG
ncbi:hypothetical protein [Rhodococcus pyridinivorans]